MGIIHLVLAFLKAFFAGRAVLAAENLALRHQLAVLQRSVKRPMLCKSDRIFWSWLSRLWWGWKSALPIVQPAGDGPGAPGFAVNLSSSTCQASSYW